MLHRLIIFPTPSDARCELRHDALGGVVIIGIPAEHESGRKGISFLFPDGTPDGNGARLWISAPGKVPLDIRGIIWLGDSGVAYFQVDDFRLIDEVKVPPPIPFPIPPKPPDLPIVSKNPLEMIKSIFEKGDFDLKTKEGCGKFTEECVRALHGILSKKYGHIRKNPPQNMYNGHAVDALMLLEKHDDTEAGIYDIILANESSDAKPQFIYRGVPVPELWYYPA